MSNDETGNVRTCPECGRTKPESEFWHAARRCRSCVAQASANKRSLRTADWKQTVRRKHKVNVAPSKKRYDQFNAEAHTSAAAEIPETSWNKFGCWLGCAGPIAIAIGVLLLLGKRSGHDEGAVTLAAGVSALLLCWLLNKDRSAAVETLTAAKLDSSITKHEQDQLEYEEFYRTPEWKQLRHVVIRRDGSTCRSCGKLIVDAFDLTIDHIKPRSRYPELALELTNLRVTCRPCNSSKGARDIVENAE